MSAARNLPSPEVFIGEVLPPPRKAEILRVLPSHVKPEVFERNLANAIMNNPKLLQCKPEDVFREVAKLAALGLLLDQQLGEAYLIVAGGWGNKPLEPQARIGYRGLIKLARQSGEISQIYAHEVREGDEIVVSLGDDKHLVHKPKPFSTAPVIGYYAVAKYEDGINDFELMSLERIYEIRDRSDGWRAYKDDRIKSTPWSTDETEMAKKTVIRNLVKRLPASPQLADAIGIEDRAEYAELSAVPVAALEPPAPPAMQIEQQGTRPVQQAVVTSGRTSQPYADMGGSPAGNVEWSEDGEQPDETPRWEKLLADLKEELSRCKTTANVDTTVDNFAVDVRQAPTDVRKEAIALVKARKEVIGSQQENEGAPAAKDAADTGRSPASAAEEGPASDGPTPKPRFYYREEDDQLLEAEGDPSVGFKEIDETTYRVIEARQKGSASQPEPEPPAPPADVAPAPAVDPKLEELLSDARTAAMEGKVALRRHFNSLPSEDRDLLRPHDSTLYAAAEAAENPPKQEG